MSTDITGTEFKIGDLVVRCKDECTLEFRRVTRIEGNTIWLNDSHVAINYPSRLAIVNEIEQRVDTANLKTPVVRRC